MTDYARESTGAGRTGRALAAIVICALAVYWAGNARTPLWDRDEPRFAEAAREMLETRDFVVPRFNGEVRYDKPILGYYPMAAGMALFGVNEFGARFFSGVFGALSVLVTFFLARRITGRSQTALMAAAFLAFAPVMVAESKLCTVDALLLFLLLLSFSALWRIYEGPCKARWKALLWVSLAAAVLTKGPVALAAVFAPVVLMTLLSRDRSFLKRFGWWWGAPLFVAVFLPWVLAVQSRTGGEFLRVALGRHVIERSATAFEGHSGFPGFYVVTLFATFFPWAFFVPGAVWQSARGLRDRRSGVFLLSWAAGLILVLELIRTKMVHYSLPVFPALAILVALFLERAVEAKPRLIRAGVIGAGAMAVLLAAVPVAAVGREELTRAVVPFAVSGGILVAAMAAWLLLARAKRGHWAGAAASFAWLIALSAWALPVLGSYGVSKPLAQVVAEARRELAAGGLRAEPTVAFYGYEEPSLVFYLGGVVEFPEAPGRAAEIHAPGAPDIIAVSLDLPVMTQTASESGFVEAGGVFGFNFAKGRREEVSVWMRPAAVE